MEREDIIRLVTEEVMRRLGTPQSVQPAVKQALALFTGGALGLEEALAQLAQLQHQGVRLTAVLSKAAETVIGVDRLRKALGMELAHKCIDLFDFDFDYTHENPFPVNGRIDRKKVDASFEQVFSKAAEFLK